MSEGAARRARVSLRCLSAVVVVPASARSPLALECRLERLESDNHFEGDVDVRDVRLQRTELWAVRCGPAGLVRLAAPLLSERCTLQLRLERRRDPKVGEAELTVLGSLDELECALDPAQYGLVRGVLAHNLAEDVSDLEAPVSPAPSSAARTLTSVRLELQNVTVRLEPEHDVDSLACINFIKSRLLLETYSDLSQDIDLVSQVSAHRAGRRAPSRFSNSTCTGVCRRSW